MKVPKPPKKIEIPPDKNLERLEKWKELFSGIDPSVSVYINNGSEIEDGFHEKYRSTVGYTLGLEPSNAYILILLSHDFPESYLVGESHDHMFSYEDVINDPLFGEDGIPAEPKTQSWAKWYKVICERFKIMRERVPEPPPVEEDKNAGT